MNKYKIGDIVRFVNEKKNNNVSYIGKIIEVWKNPNDEGRWWYWVEWDAITLCDWYPENSLELNTQQEMYQENDTIKQSKKYETKSIFEGMDGAYFNGRVYPYIISMKKEQLTGMLVKLSKHRNESELNDLYCLLENLYNVGNK